MDLSFRQAGVVLATLVALVLTYPVAPEGPVSRLLELTNLKQHFSVYQDRDEAISAASVTATASTSPFSRWIRARSSSTTAAARST